MDDGVGNLGMQTLLKFAEQNTRKENAAQRRNSRDQKVPIQYSVGY